MHDSAWQARPSVLATKVALMEELGLVEQAAATLSNALQHWQAGRQRGLHSALLLVPATHGACRKAGSQLCACACPWVLLASDSKAQQHLHPCLHLYTFCAAPDSALRRDALPWIASRLAALQLSRGAVVEAAALYKQLVTADAATLTGGQAAW